MIEAGRNTDRSKLLALLLFPTGRIANCVRSTHEPHKDIFIIRDAVTLRLFRA